jgi:hypothetical protein
MLSSQEQALDPALRAANDALVGSRDRDASRFASIELKFADRHAGPWEMAAMTSVAIAAALVVVGVWLL